MSDVSDLAALAARRLAETVAAQRRASDPATSAWVSANAGAGKTHVLKMRVLRLLLAGTAPSRILCLTYTKAAAAEMSARVFADLARWAAAGDEPLRSAVSDLLGRAPDDIELTRARQLFALAVETPGGLKVQTIHAFCEKLLQRFPLEAGVVPGFRILDDELAAEIRAEAIADALGRAVSQPDSRAGRALTVITSRTQGEGFDDLVRAALAERDWLAAAAAIGEPVDATRDDDALERAYRTALGARADVAAAELEAEMAAVLDEAEMRRFAGQLAEGTKTDAGLGAALLAAARAGSPSERVAALATVFLTQAGEPRSDARFITKKLRAADPGMTDRMTAARDRFAILARESVALKVAEASTALAVLADEVMRRFEDGKAARAALDFDDLVILTARLLSGSAEAAWVLFKLDGGLDHILVDEAQDTSEVQWRVVQALADEFFSGAGQTDAVRTIFAVGDEKQSIYSFQGAAPEKFRATGAEFGNAAARAGLALASVPLELSFRTVEPLLAAVDRVFADAARTPGVGGAGAVVRHHARRLGQAGLLEIWPTDKPDTIEDTAAFDPLEEIAAGTPVARLAARIADTIAGWLADGERLTSADRPIRPGDVIILLRKRHPFGPAMVAALKARGIPVAGADRIRLTQQIAVQDLLALASFLVLPEDDLALASLLKSPLFDLDDDDLIRLAPGRPGSLWSSLLAAAADDRRYENVATRLKRWRARADFLPPFEFLAWLIDSEGVRSAMLTRLGPEAADAIDELVNLALAYDESAPPSLQGFLAWLASGEREIKRDLEHGRDEVRVMTVHGAKGLEAPIVFLPDTCSAPTGGRPSPVVTLHEAPSPTGLAWAIKGASGIPAIEEARETERRLASEEHQRLLYVAMTRPRDRLYVAGFEGAKGRPRDCWYDLIVDGLEDCLERREHADGAAVMVLQSAQSASPEPASDLSKGTTAGEPLPDWAMRPAPRETGLAVPLAPSRLAPLESDDEGEPVERPRAAAEGPREPRFPTPATLVTGNRFLRGTLTHALLQHLPALPRESWTEAAHRLLDQRAKELSPTVRADIAREALAVLCDPAFADVFGPGSRAEVAIAAAIPHPGGRAAPLRIAGQIDRMVMRDSDVLIVDFKTNRPPPAVPEDVADAYVLQLAAYRLAVSKLAGVRAVRAALVWTDGARLMELPAALLDRGETELWALAGARLDG
ncbi:MAG: double-strand break repair helicase AddA [Hyphomicrobiaceae bacterium]